MGILEFIFVGVIIMVFFGFMAACVLFMWLIIIDEFKDLLVSRKRKKMYGGACKPINSNIPPKKK